MAFPQKQQQNSVARRTSGPSKPRIRNHKPGAWTERNVEGFLMSLLNQDVGFVCDSEFYCAQLVKVCACECMSVHMCAHV